MSLQIDLPANIQDEIEKMALRRGQKVEEVIAALVTDYVSTRPGATEANQAYRQVEQSQAVYHAFKERVREQYGIPADVPPQALAAQIDELSEKVAANLQFKDWTAAEAFMRGEDRDDLP
jgi:hypothetical protein